MTAVEVRQITSPGQSTTLTGASSQWRNRPADQRFETIESLDAAARAHSQNSRESIVNIGTLSMREENDEILLDGDPMNNWAFGQFATSVKAPASYLRSLPANLAMKNLRHGLDQVSEDTMRKLLISDGRIGAFTSEGYARIWNSEITGWLLELQASQPWWTFPVAFRQAGGGEKDGAWGESKELPVAFLSDRDMFVFLTDMEHSIEVPGSDTPLMRGFWIENNEVGAGSVRITMFLYDYVCSNVMVWGARNVVEVKIAHKGRARERVLFDDSEAKKAIQAYNSSSSMADTLRIKKAMNTLIAPTTAEVVSEIYRHRLPGLSKTILEQAVILAESTPRYQLGEGPTSVWALMSGLTEISQRCEHADARVEIDRSASRILDMTCPQ